VCRRGPIEISPRRAAAGASNLAGGIDDDIAHPSEIDHEPIVAHAEAGRIVTAATHGERQIVLACETERCLNVVDALAACDARWAAVDHPVPHFAGSVVCVRTRAEEVSAKAGAELAQAIFRNNCDGHVHWFKFLW
jgi:hypothetical protein